MSRLSLIAISIIFSAVLASAARKDNGTSSSASSSPAAATPAVAQEHDSLRIEGEQRFRTNCGRCHQPPHKFPPRMMATIIRHMRVRAMLTDEDMKAILAYMTE